MIPVYSPTAPHVNLYYLIVVLFFNSRRTRLKGVGKSKVDSICFLNLCVVAQPQDLGTD